MALVHDFDPVSSTERAHADITVGPLSCTKGAYGESSNVGRVEAGFEGFSAGELGVPEDVARSRELVGDRQGRR